MKGVLYVQRKKLYLLRLIVPFPCTTILWMYKETEASSQRLDMVEQ